MSGTVWFNDIFKGGMSGQPPGRPRLTNAPTFAGINQRMVIAVTVPLGTHIILPTGDIVGMYDITLPGG